MDSYNTATHGNQISSCQSHNKYHNQTYGYYACTSVKCATSEELCYFKYKVNKYNDFT